MSEKPSTKTLSEQGRVESTPSQKLTPSQLMGDTAKEGVDFDAIGGESYVGLNLLQLDIDEADGPFTVKKIEPTVFGSGKAAKTIDVYVTNKGTTEVRMPVSASFMTKMVEAKIKVGDTFYVKRGKNFSSKVFGTENCKSYLLKVTHRG